jgi:hypothetical protein
VGRWAFSPAHHELTWPWAYLASVVAEVASAHLSATGARVASVQKVPATYFYFQEHFRFVANLVKFVEYSYCLRKI